MELQVGDKVSLIIGVETDLGFTVLIDEEFEGLLYKNEVFQPLKEGQRIDGYIKNIREDGKIDVSLQPQGFKNVISIETQKIIAALERNQGFLALTDKSSPEEIKMRLAMSKKAFKRAIGSLYKQQQILITEKGIELIKK
ncbi:MAG: DNA-binding protein [Flavobacteriaceae bacterium]|nr:DNA-binding protein [Flavobacteriaceae bacterium]